jgi:hypothetical protein
VEHAELNEKDTARGHSESERIAVNIAITVWNTNGNMIGTSSVALAPYNKTEAVLHTLPGLVGMAGNRGSAQFSVSTGNVAVLGLRFLGEAFMSDSNW